MTYLNQPWFNRQVINRIAMATGVVHSQTLTVTTRTSKQPQKIPVTPVEVDGVKYLVSTRGESQWVKYVADETPVQNRQPILHAYKVKAGKVVENYFRKLPDPADHPVFTLTPAT
jgi:hypothetical protein